MRKARKNVQAGLGATSILMIFVILCMMILSVLSYVRAKQNEETALRERTFQESYLQADTSAQILYEMLKEHSAQNSNMKELCKVPGISDRLEEKTLSYHVEEDILDLEVQVNETQKLTITFKKTVDSIEKQSWKLVSSGGQSK